MSITVKEIIEYYNKKIDAMSDVKETEGQGKVRAGMGKLFENVAEMLISSVDSELICKRNDYLKKYSPSGKYFNDKLQVDLHVYHNEKIICIIECKTYLDACYLKRAVRDFEDIRSVVGNVPAIILTGQNALADNTLGFFNECYDFKIFFCNKEKKRNVKRPVYEGRNLLDEEALENFRDYIRKLGTV